MNKITITINSETSEFNSYNKACSYLDEMWNKALEIGGDKMTKFTKEDADKLEYELYKNTKLLEANIQEMEIRHNHGKNQPNPRQQLLSELEYKKRHDKNN